MFRKQGEKRRRFPNYPLQNYEEKRVVLKSSSTKQMTATQIIEKKLFSGLKNLIDESADSRLNWNGIVSKVNRPCGFNNLHAVSITILYLRLLHNSLKR